MKEIVYFEDCYVKASLNSATVLGIEKHEVETWGVFDYSDNKIDRKLSPDDFEHIRETLESKHRFKRRL